MVLGIKKNVVITALLNSKQYSLAQHEMHKSKPQGWGPVIIIPRNQHCYFCWSFLSRSSESISYDDITQLDDYRLLEGADRIPFWNNDLMTLSSLQRNSDPSHKLAQKLSGKWRKTSNMNVGHGFLLVSNQREFIGKGTDWMISKFWKLPKIAN